jgi:CheY-like chemotaxis protein
MTSPGAIDGRRRRILFADDIELNRTLIGGILGAAGFDVDVVADGPAAIGALAADSYDLVLMDIDMPGLDGRDASAFIRRMGGRAAVPPIVALTARNGAGDREKSLAVGMRDHIARPISPGALVARITEILVPPAEAPEATTPILCQTTYHGLTAMLGPDRVAMFVSLLVTRLHCMKTMLHEGAGQRAEITHHAHDLVSAAGMLGFFDVSQSCRSFLTAAHDKTTEPDFAPLASAVDRALAVIDVSQSAETQAATP